MNDVGIKKIDDRLGDLRGHYFTARRLGFTVKSPSNLTEPNPNPKRLAHFRVLLRGLHLVNFAIMLIGVELRKCHVHQGGYSSWGSTAWSRSRANLWRPRVAAKERGTTNGSFWGAVAVHGGALGILVAFFLSVS